MMISTTNGALPNIDAGKALQFADIVDDITNPIRKDEGAVYCYLCQQNHRLEELTPLTSSSGVFTLAVTCRDNAPVYLCLEHIPHSHDQFEAFTPEVQEVLRAALSAKRKQVAFIPGQPVPIYAAGVPVHQTTD